MTGAARGAVGLAAVSALACGFGRPNRGACDDLRACVAANEPSRLASVDDRFGEGADCWDEGPRGRRTCEQQCAIELSSCEGRDTARFDTGAPPPRVRVFVDWRVDGLTVRVPDVEGTGFDLGLAETGAVTDGWFGEDCFEGSGGFHLCHGFMGPEGSLTTVASPDEVVAGATTRFSVTREALTTGMVTFDDGSCVAFGQSPAYYASFGCREE